MKIWIGWVLFVYIVILLLIVGTVDRAEEIAGEKQYCQKVGAGEWPDYKKIYKTYCKTESLELE